MGPGCLQSISYLIFVSWIHTLLLTLDTYLGLSIIEYMYPGYTYCFRPWIHIMGSCLQSVSLIDSSSLTNEKDHHYFLNSADVCW